MTERVKLRALSESERHRVLLQRRQDAAANASSRADAGERIRIDESCSWTMARRTTARRRSVTAWRWPTRRARASRAGSCRISSGIVQPNMGLSYARNAGAHAATRRDLCLHRQRLHGRSGLALLHGRHAAQRRLRRRRRAEHLAAGGRTGFRPRSPPRPAGRATCCSPMSWPSTSPAATWPFTAAAFESVGGFDHRISQGRRRRGLLLAAADQRRRHRVLPERDRLALPALHAPRLSQAAGRLRRSGSRCCVQAPHLFRPDRTGEMEGPDLRRAALYLALQQAGHLSRRLRPRPFSVHLPDAAERDRGLL